MRCVICGKEFEPCKRHNLCCSVECSDKLKNRRNNYRRKCIRLYGKKPKKMRKCPMCGKMFEARLHNQMTCSSKCKRRYYEDYQQDFTYPVNALELVFSAHPRYYSKQFLKTSKKN